MIGADRWRRTLFRIGHDDCGALPQGSPEAESRRKPRLDLSRAGYRIRTKPARFPSPLVGEDRLGRKPSEEGGARRRAPGRSRPAVHQPQGQAPRDPSGPAPAAEGTRPLVGKVLHARRPPSRSASGRVGPPHKGGGGSDLASKCVNAVARTGEGFRGRGARSVAGAPPYPYIRVASKAGTRLAKSSSQATSFGWSLRHLPSKRRSR